MESEGTRHNASQQDTSAAYGSWRPLRMVLLIWLLALCLYCWVALSVTFTYYTEESVQLVCRLKGAPWRRRVKYYRNQIFWFSWEFVIWSEFIWDHLLTVICLVLLDLCSLLWQTDSTIKHWSRSPQVSDWPDRDSSFLPSCLSHVSNLKTQRVN